MRYGLALLLVTLGCRPLEARGPDRATGAQAEPLGEGACTQGAATYYADSLAGKRTASGEPYDPGLMTAAHRSLPFGTRLSVSWQGREVQVRVNDRGGPRGGVDLSRAAAEQLAMIKAGRVQARICRLP